MRHLIAAVLSYVPPDSEIVISNVRVGSSACVREHTCMLWYLIVEDNRTTGFNT